MQWVLTRLAVGFKSVPLRTGKRFTLLFFRVGA